MESKMENKTIQLPKKLIHKKKKFKIPYTYHSVWEIVYQYDEAFIEWFRKKYMVPYVNEYICTREDRKKESVLLLQSLGTDEKLIDEYQKKFDCNTTIYITDYLQNPNTLERELDKHGFRLDYLDDETDNYCRDTTKKSTMKTVSYTLDRGILCDTLVTRKTSLETETEKHLVEESCYMNANYHTFNIYSDHEYRVLEYSPEYRQEYSNLFLIEVIQHRKDIKYDFQKAEWNAGIFTKMVGDD